MAKPDPALLDWTRYPCTHQVTTRYGDLDPNGHINHIAMAAAFEDSRARMYGALGRPATQALLIVSVTIEYLAEAFYPNPLDLFSGVSGIGRTSWTVAQLARQEGRVVACCTSVMLTLAEGRPVLPPDWREALLSCGLREGLRTAALGA